MSRFTSKGQIISQISRCLLPYIAQFGSVCAALMITCSAATTTAPAPVPELVLKPGSRLSVSTLVGSVGVVAGTDVSRTYEWNGCSLKSNMAPRGTRWLGALGIYDPAPRVLPALPRNKCKGLSRTVVDESQIHFEDVASAELWLKRYCTHSGAYGVWSNDGLVACITTSPSREQFNMSLRQICVKGNLPTVLLGATDSAFTMTHLTVTYIAREQCALASPKVIHETRVAWEKEWAWVDEQKRKYQELQLRK
jgi:hypothetical protein